MSRGQPSIATFFSKSGSVASEAIEEPSKTSPGPSQPTDAQDFEACAAKRVKVDKFQERWLRRWPWLECDSESSSMFCGICKVSVSLCFPH